MKIKELKKIIKNLNDNEKVKIEIFIHDCVPIISDNFGFDYDYEEKTLYLQTEDIKKENLTELSVITNSPTA